MRDAQSGKAMLLIWTTAVVATLCLAAPDAAAHRAPEPDLSRVNPAPILPDLKTDSDAPVRYAQYGDYKAREQAQKKAAKQKKKEAKKANKQKTKKKPGKIKEPSRKDASKARQPAYSKSPDKARQPAYKKSKSKARTDKPARSKYTGPAKKYK